MSKEVQPHAMTIVTTGANHGLLFKSKAAATAAYRSLQKGAIEFRKFDLMNKSGPILTPAQIENAPAAFVELTDDFGVLCTVDLRELKSFRFADIGQEHDGAGEMKLAEVQAAVRFETHVKENHADLYNLRARGPGSLWTPGSRQN